jgi:hypothetical protein
VEGRALVVQRFSGLAHTLLTCAEGAEVLGGLGNDWEDRLASEGKYTDIDEAGWELECHCSPVEEWVQCWCWEELLVFGLCGTRQPALQRRR